MQYGKQLLGPFDAEKKLFAVLGREVVPCLDGATEANRNEHDDYMLFVWLLKRLRWIKPATRYSGPTRPTPSKSSRVLHEHLHEAYAGFACLLSIFYKCTGAVHTFPYMNATPHACNPPYFTTAAYSSRATS